MKHTPTPWRHEEQFLPEDLGRSNGIFIFGNKEYPIADVFYDKGDADFIVKAVNCHDELVEALKAIIFSPSKPNIDFAKQALEKAEEL